MRTSVNASLIASLAVLAVGGTPICAASAATQAENPEDSKTKEIASWPAEKQASYSLWPVETKDYYWSLSPSRQKLFWGLTDADKVTLSGMDEEEQAKVWARLEMQEGSQAPSD